MKIKRIGIDLDNTVADFMSGAAPLIEEHYGLKPDLTKEAYSIVEVFGITKGELPPGMKDKLYEGLHLFNNLPLLEKDINLLPRRIYLQMAIPHQIDTKIYFITARPASPIVMEDTIHWLEKNHFYFDDVFFVEDKLRLCQDMKIDVMLDDEKRQVVGLAAAGINVVLRDQPWNRQVSSTKNLVRVFNWRESLEATKEFLI